MSEPAQATPNHLTLNSPARFEIHVQGEVPGSWADRFGEMRVASFDPGDGRAVSVLIGRVRDQAALMGILQSLYGLQLPLISVELRAVESE